MEELFTIENFQRKIHRQYELLLKTKDTDMFIHYIADFFNFLCQDLTLFMTITDLLKNEIYMEQEVTELNEDLNIIMSNVLNILIDLVNEKSLEEKLRLFEENDRDVIPLYFEKGGQLNNDPQVLHQRLIDADKFIQENKLEKEVNDRLRTIYSKPVMLRNREKLFLFYIKEDWEFQKEAWVDWDSIKTQIDNLHTYNVQILIQKKLSVKYDLLNILSYIKHHYAYLKSLDELYKMNKCIEDYRQTNRTLIVLAAKDKCIWLENLEFKLEKIVNAILNNLEKKWNIDTLIKHYALKTEEFGVERIKNLIREKGESHGEKICQLDLGEFLFSKGLKPIMEKQFSRDRLDILSTGIEESIIEVKLFKKLDAIIDIFQGFAQTIKYSKEHQKSIGYYIIYQTDVDYKLITEPVYRIGNLTIYTYVIDLTSLSGRFDKREHLVLSSDEVNNYLNNKDNELVKNWKEVLLSDLLSIKGIGGVTSLKIFKQRKSLKKIDILRITGVGFGRLKSIEKRFLF
ncbi:hypothetical protein DRW41_05105 [Neobacillus piezotolerans]|uniref:Uncharacterized protein n=1 Tax=Neobacillus piezotolerans TaxID=2259171 RepID=A0A3D8GWW1_9BACI|nr:hypothetical protein [Neobacillus piezotolerans]RDU38935.1 hypothetical protein DRW41_05105 [Neobacillus piezotolerans]